MNSQDRMDEQPKTSGGALGPQRNGKSHGDGQPNRHERRAAFKLGGSKRNQSNDRARMLHDESRVSRGSRR